MSEATPAPDDDALAEQIRKIFVREQRGEITADRADTKIAALLTRHRLRSALSRPGVMRLAVLRMADLIDEESPDHRVAKALGVRAYVPASIVRKAIARIKHHPDSKHLRQS